MALTRSSGKTRDSLLFGDPKRAIALVEENVPSQNKQPPWKVLVVDDDDPVHEITTMVLSEFKYKNRGLDIAHAYSGAEARQFLAKNTDVAVVLLDVVMETDTAGLETIQYIRQKLANHFVRIILRTGQPGQAPEHEVISKYDINDYKEKTELTTQKLFTSMITALRAYDDLRNVERLITANMDLENSARERTLEILKINEDLQAEILERNNTLEKLRLSESRLNEAQQIAGIGSWEWNISEDKLVWSEQLYEITGIRPGNAAETFNDVLDVVVEGDKEMVRSILTDFRENGTPYDIEHRIVRSDGTMLFIHQQGKVTRDDEGTITCVAGTVQDITQRRQTEEQMRKLSGAVEQIADSVMITDHNGTIEYINPAFESMTGYSSEEVIGKTPRILKSNKQSQAYYERLWKTILSGEVFSDVIINHKKNGQIYYEEKTITPQQDHYGNIVHFIATGKDVTERIEAQERLHHLAHHDALTGLPNRVLLQDRLEQAIARSRWHSRKVAVLFIDVDRFKLINDTLGHDVGDQLLKSMAQRLDDCTREGDTVARLGGDEFAVVLNDIAAQKDIAPIADKILNSLGEPILVNQQELFVTVSIGISLFPRDGNDSHELLKKADVAMYRAKAQGKDNYQLYNENDESTALERLSMETRLRRALDRDEFHLNYQPQVSINNNTVEGIEALLRWHNPDLKNISPGQFIPILEETGMINAVGDWVLQTACQQEKQWQQEGLFPHRVAVNLSIRQFQRQGLVKRIEEILGETGLEPRYLELEITEGLLIDQISETAKVLHELNEMGVSLSIDDFGTGYSSMNYLKRLPFDNLKIDRMFIRDITFNPDDAAIASAIISLGHTLGMEVIAEGVETTEQLRYLKKQGCDAIQGFLYSPPLTAEALNILIKQTGGPKVDFSS